MEKGPLHEQLRKARQAAEIPTNELAPRMGMTVATLVNRERGQSTIRPRELESFLAGLLAIDAERRGLLSAGRTQLLEQETVSGAELRDLRRALKVNCQEVAAAQSLRADALRLRELQAEPWEVSEVASYLEALVGLVEDRSQALQEEVERLRPQAASSHAAATSALPLAAEAHVPLQLSQEPASRDGAAAAAGAKFLILAVGEGDLWRFLKGDIPEAAVVARVDTTLQRACIQAKALLLGKGKAQVDGHGVEREELLLLDPQDPANQQTTKLYAKRWLNTAYAYRVPCGEWERCENPQGPVTVHYSPPSKNPDRQGPALCRHCRLLQGPTGFNRQITAERNRQRRGKEPAAAVQG